MARGLYLAKHLFTLFIFKSSGSIKPSLGTNLQYDTPHYHRTNLPILLTSDLQVGREEEEEEKEKDQEVLEQKKTVKVL